jgi:hypothetical protein
MRRSVPVLIWKFDGKSRRKWHGEHDYREVSRWQREASGLTDWEHKQSRLNHPTTEWRFNPGYVGNTKGVKPSAIKKWLHFDQMKLPVLKPPGYKAPRPLGRAAWPKTWTEEFAQRILSFNNKELRQYALETLTTVIHEEAQRDGIELRRLDMEGNPMTELPEEAIIAHYNIEEPVLRDRLIERAMEEPFGFVPNSQQRENIRDVPSFIDFIVARVTTCRVSKRVVVTDAVVDFLNQQAVQPEFGYQHALPQDTRAALPKAWASQFHYAWQFGNAKYRPQDNERDDLTPTFIETEAKLNARQAFEEELKSGQLRQQHLDKIKEAARTE